MAFIKCALLLIALVICFPARTIAGQRGDDASDERVEVQRAVANFIEAFNNLDWERFRRCFADDASVFNPAIPEVAELHRLDGREKIEKIFEVVFVETKKGKSHPPYLDIRPAELRIQMLQNAAIVTFHFNRGGSSFGRRTLVFEKRDARWLIVHLHASNAP